MFVQFDLTDFKTLWSYGMKTRDTVFTAFESWSFSCNARPIELWSTGGISADSKPTWSSQPTWKEELKSVNVAKGWGSSCSAGDVEFATPSTTKIGDYLREGLTKGWDTLTFGLRAGDETDTYGWKRFRNNFRLTFSYNTPPSKPNAQKIQYAGPDIVGCVTGAGRPAINDNSVVLSVNSWDSQSPGAQGTDIGVDFFVTGRGKDGAAMPLPTGWTRVDAATIYRKIWTGRQGDGTFTTGDVLTGIPDGIYSWNAQADDTITKSEISDTCEFELDTVKPEPVVITADPTNPYADTQRFVGGVGQKGKWLFSSASPAAEIDHYEWAFDRDTGMASLPAGVAEADLAPVNYGVRTLYARAVDRAGNESLIGTGSRYTFKVARACDETVDCPQRLAWWRLNGTTADKGKDYTGDPGPNPLTFGPETSGVDEGTRKATRFNGKEEKSYATTTKTVVSTQGAFRASAWVRLNGSTLPAEHMAAVSQGGDQRIAFQLGYVHNGPDGPSWAAAMANPEGSPAGIVEIYASGDKAPSLNEWTHLSLSYDPPANAADPNALGTLKLWVNNEEADSVSFRSTKDSAGPLQIGRARWSKIFKDYWIGDIDDVRLYAVPLAEGELGPEKNGFTDQ